MDRDRRISFFVDEECYKKAATIPWGLRSAILRALLLKAIDAAERQGDMIYGAIIGGDFSIKHTEGKRK